MMYGQKTIKLCNAVSFCYEFLYLTVSAIVRSCISNASRLLTNLIAVLKHITTRGTVTSHAVQEADQQCRSR
jgi:hypothetical protein